LAVVIVDVLDEDSMLVMLADAVAITEAAFVLETELLPTLPGLAIVVTGVELADAPGTLDTVAVLDADDMTVTVADAVAVKEAAFAFDIELLPTLPGLAIVVIVAELTDAPGTLALGIIIVAVDVDGMVVTFAAAAVAPDVAFAFDTELLPAFPGLAFVVMVVGLADAPETLTLGMVVVADADGMVVSFAATVAATDTGFAFDIELFPAFPGLAIVVTAVEPAEAPETLVFVIIIVVAGADGMMVTFAAAAAATEVAFALDELELLPNPVSLPPATVAITELEYSISSDVVVAVTFCGCFGAWVVTGDGGSVTPLAPAPPHGVAVLGLPVVPLATVPELELLMKLPGAAVAI
jgi:hypothetical protein